MRTREGYEWVATLITKKKGGGERPCMCLASLPCPTHHMVRARGDDGSPCLGATSISPTLAGICSFGDAKGYMVETSTAGP